MLTKVENIKESQWFSFSLFICLLNFSPKNGLIDLDETFTFQEYEFEILFTTMFKYDDKTCIQQSKTNNKTNK